MEGLLNEFESNTSYTGMVEGMMKQLISKEILYEPMKEMYDKVGNGFHGLNSSIRPGWKKTNPKLLNRSTRTTSNSSDL